MNSGYARIRSLSDVVVWPTFFVKRDVYTNLANGKEIDYYVRSFEGGSFLDLSRLETLRDDIKQEKIFVKRKNRDRHDILTEEEMGVLLDTSGKFRAKTSKRDDHLRRKGEIRTRFDKFYSENALNALRRRQRRDLYGGK